MQIDCKMLWGHAIDSFECFCRFNTMQPFNQLSAERWVVDPRPCIRCGKPLGLTRLEDRCGCLDELTEFCQKKVLSGRWVLPSRSQKCKNCGGMEWFCVASCVRSKHSNPSSAEFLAFKASLLHCRWGGAEPGAVGKTPLIQRRRVGEPSTPVQRMGAEAPRRRFSSEFVDGVTH